MTEVSSGVLMEVELGKYAQEHAASNDVKQFGAKMVENHSKDRAALEALATKKNITIPSRPADDFQKHIDELEKYEGAEFDKKYISFMVSDHHDDMDEFNKEVKNGKDLLIESTEFTIRKDEITQLYYGYEEPFSTFQTRGMGLTLAPIRIRFDSTEFYNEKDETDLYLVSKFNRAFSENQNLFEELKLWLS